MSNIDKITKSRNLLSCKNTQKVEHKVFLKIKL